MQASRGRSGSSHVATHACASASAPRRFHLASRRPQVSGALAACFLRSLQRCPIVPQTGSNSTWDME